MRLITWDPFRDLDEFVSRYSALMRPGEELGWRPAADISETESEYLVKADLPGVEKKDIHITVENGQLRLSGERREEKRSDRENEIRVERFHGAFSRSFALPEDADVDNIQAECRDGCLTVRIPRKQSAKPARKEISIH